MSIKTSHIGNNWIIFLAISIAMHLALLALSFSPEALKLITPEPRQIATPESKRPFYVDVITLPPDAAGKKITPKLLTRFANESRSVEIEGSPRPALGLGSGKSRRDVRAKPQSAKAATKPDLYPDSARPKATASSKGSKKTQGQNAGKATDTKTNKNTGSSASGKFNKTQSKAAKKTDKTRSGKAVIKDNVIIIEQQPAAAVWKEHNDQDSKTGSSVNNGTKNKTGLGKAGNLGNTGSLSKTGGRGEVGPPSLFPSNESIARVVRKTRRSGGDALGGIYMRNRTKQLQLNATELKDARYLLDLKRKLALYWNYPPAAARRGEQGTVRALFKVKRDGTIYDIKLDKSSGYPTLDDAVINALRLCSPLNPLPDDFKKEELKVRARFKYILTLAH